MNPFHFVTYSTLIHKKVHTGVFLIFLSTLFYSATYAQSNFTTEYKTIYYLEGTEDLSQTNPNSKTILIRNPIAPSYSKKQNKWLVKNDFLIIDYKWDDPEINSNVKNALIARTISNFGLRCAAFAFIRGLFINFAAQMADNDKERFNGTNSYLAAGGLAIFSGITIGIGKGKLRLASQKRKYQLVTQYQRR